MRNKVKINATIAYKKLIQNKYSKYPKVLNQIKDGKNLEKDMKDCVISPRGYDDVKNKMGLIKYDLKNRSMSKEDIKYYKNQYEIGKKMEKYSRLSHGKFFDTSRLGEINSYIDDMPKVLQNKLGIHCKNSLLNGDWAINNKTNKIEPLKNVFKNNHAVLQSNHKLAQRIKNQIHYDLHNKFKSQKPQHKQYKKALHKAEIHQRIEKETYLSPLKPKRKLTQRGIKILVKQARKSLAQDASHKKFKHLNHSKRATVQQIHSKHSHKTINKQQKQQEIRQQGPQR